MAEESLPRLLEPESRAAAIKSIRNALHVGLASFGEGDRLCENNNTREVICKIERLPEEVRPMHPTGRSDTTSGFAEALIYLEMIAEESHGR